MSVELEGFFLWLSMVCMAAFSGCGMSPQEPPAWHVELAERVDWIADSVVKPTPDAEVEGRVLKRLDEIDARLTWIEVRMLQLEGKDEEEEPPAPPTTPPPEESPEPIHNPDGSVDLLRGEKYRLTLEPPEQTEPVADETSEPEPEAQEEPDYTPQVIFYSPTWDCEWCVAQSVENVKLGQSGRAPFTIKHVVRDGMGAYPQTYFSTPDDGWKRWTGFISADTILREWRKYHDCPAASQTAKSPANPEVERTVTLAGVRAMNSGQLRDLIRRWGTSLPRGGTVVGMTVTYHLLNDHGFKSANIAGLNEGERHAVHQIAHNLEGRSMGRVTSGTPRSAAQAARGSTAPVRSFSNKRRWRRSR